MTPPKTIWKHPIHFIAFGFGSGLAPFMPGTFGTLAAIPFYLLMQYLPIAWYAGLLLLLIIFGIWVCDVTEKALGKNDHSSIVFDEMLGYWITLLAAPKGWFWIALGFALFRAFDIWKPWPIKWLDKKVKGGLGVVADDLLAGVYAWIVLQTIAVFL